MWSIFGQYSGFCLVVNIWWNSSGRPVIDLEIIHSHTTFRHLSAIAPGVVGCSLKYFGFISALLRCSVKESMLCGGRVVIEELHWLSLFYLAIEAFSLIFARFVEKIQDYTVLRIYFRNQDHNFGDIDWWFWSLCFFVSQAFLRCVWNLWPCFRYSRNNGWIWMQKVKLKLSCCL